MQRASLLLALILLLTLGSGPSFAQEHPDRAAAESAVKMVPELFLVRPAAGVLALVPTAAFLGTLPLTYPLGYSQKAATVLVQKPWEFVGNRPFGVFLEQQSVMTQANDQFNSRYSEFLGRTGANRDLLDLK